MRNDPLLAGPKQYTDERDTLRITVRGGLHYIKGNSAPYFSITADVDIYERGAWRDYMGGCCHEEILAHFPQLEDAVAMHSSYIDGAPSYAEQNGWYWLAGAAGGMGEAYHGSNGSSAKTPEECRRIFAEHCRIPEHEAAGLIELCKAELGTPQESEMLAPFKRSDYARARAVWTRLCDSMRARWADEAKACIAKHNLVVYGDAWAAA